MGSHLRSAAAAHPSPRRRHATWGTRKGDRRGRDQSRPSDAGPPTGASQARSAGPGRVVDAAQRSLVVPMPGAGLNPVLTPAGRTMPRKLPTPPPGPHPLLPIGPRCAARRPRPSRRRGSRSASGRRHGATGGAERHAAQSQATRVRLGGAHMLTPSRALPCRQAADPLSLDAVRPQPTRQGPPSDPAVA